MTDSNFKFPPFVEERILIDQETQTDFNDKQTQTELTGEEIMQLEKVKEEQEKLIKFTTKLIDGIKQGKIIGYLPRPQLDETGAIYIHCSICQTKKDEKEAFWNHEIKNLLFCSENCYNNRF